MIANVFIASIIKPLYYLQFDSKVSHIHICILKYTAPSLKHFILSLHSLSLFNFLINVIFLSFRLTIKCIAKNGGFLKYIDRDSGTRDIAPLKGKTVEKSLVFRWDLIKPYQECINGTKTDCDQLPVDCKDLSKKVCIRNFS